MRIGLLVLAAGRQAGGPETYEVELVRALSRSDSGHQYIVYCPQKSAAEAIGLTNKNIEYRILQPAARAISLSTTLPLFLRRDRIDVLHSTYAPPPWHTVRLVLTLHGLVNFLHPEFFPASRLNRLNPLMRRGLNQAKCVICVSQHALEQTNEYFGVPYSRLLLAYHGVSSQFKPMPRETARREVKEIFGFDGQYVLFTGKIQPGKNLERLVAAFKIFLQRTGAKTKLLLAGKVISTSLAKRLQEDSASSALILTGHVPAEKLPALYNAAEMLIFPSLFESFGLPVLEAMACGTPVVASDLPALREVAADAALFISPHSEVEIAEAMQRFYVSSDLRAEMVCRGLERAQRFTWENCASVTLDAYRRAMEC